MVAIDYFTKWMEVESLVQIIKSKMKDFIQKSVIYRFGLPHTIIIDNGRQFNNQNFKEFYANSTLCINSHQSVIPNPMEKQKS